MKFTAKNLAYGALIAAAYAASTMLLAPISYGPWQVRVSEALTVLPFFIPEAVPGLFIGCLIANLASNFGIVDIILGSLATLAAAFWTYKIKNKYLAPLPPVIVNAVVVGLIIAISSGSFTFANFAVFGLQVGLGELVACYALGLPLLLILQRKFKK